MPSSIRRLVLNSTSLSVVKRVQTEERVVPESVANDSVPSHLREMSSKAIENTKRVR